jgi:hypothetical protein
VKPSAFPQALLDLWRAREVLALCKCARRSRGFEEEVGHCLISQIELVASSLLFVRLFLPLPSVRLIANASREYNQQEIANKVTPKSDAK